MQDYEEFLCRWKFNFTHCMPSPSVFSGTVFQHLVLCVLNHYTISLGGFLAQLVEVQQEWFWWCLFRLLEWVLWQFIATPGLCHWPVTESKWGWFHSLLFLLQFFFVLYPSPSFPCLCSVMLNFFLGSSAAFWFLYASILNMSKRWDIK